MRILHALSCLVLMADPEPKWEQAAKDDGITVFSRTHPGSSVAEMKAIGMIDGSPREVWTSLRDYPHYTETMPYTEEAKVLSTEEGGKVLYFYSVINAPLTSRRDYVIKIVDESDAKDSAGTLKLTWKAATEKAPPLREGIVRVTLNDGYWILEPRDQGAKTFATYYLYTEPGGSVPKWIVNKANGTAVPAVFKAIRKVVASNKAAKK